MERERKRKKGKGTQKSEKKNCRGGRENLTRSHAFQFLKLGSSVVYNYESLLPKEPPKMCILR